MNVFLAIAIPVLFYLAGVAVTYVVSRTYFDLDYEDAWLFSFGWVFTLPVRVFMKLPEAIVQRIEKKKEARRQALAVLARGAVDENMQLEEEPEREWVTSGIGYNPAAQQYQQIFGRAGSYSFPTQQSVAGVRPQGNADTAETP